jgi:hypothetical protein
LEAADMDVESEDEDEARTKLVKEIRRAKTLRVKENLGKGSSRAQVPRKALGRSVDEFKEHLDRLGVESRHIAAAGKKRERSASRGRDNLRSAMDEVGDSRMTRSQSRGDGEGGEGAAKRRKRSKSRDTLGMKEEDVAVTRTLMKKKVRRGGAGRKLLLLCRKILLCLFFLSLFKFKLTCVTFFFHILCSKRS